jgi:RNase H-like domain found in reverse transcriptase/Reverse transcriptase (RNA-dependent DNA polymerase)/Integrase zinc binding domain
MSAFRAPPCLALDGNVAENWRRFRQSFEIFLKASGKEDEKEDIKVAMFLNLIGQDALDVYNTFVFSKDEQHKLQGVMRHFELYCNPRKNLVFEQSKFFTHAQKEGEPFDKFLTELKTLANTCEFGKQLEPMLTLRIVLGVWDGSLRERLLREGDLSLAKAAEFCRAAEVSQQQASELDVARAVTTVKSSRSRPTGRQAAQSTGQVTTWPTRDNVRECSYCGFKHAPRQCPAYGKKCNTCNAPNHFSKMCRSKKAGSTKKNVQAVQEEDFEDDADNDIYIDSVHIDSVQTNEWCENILVDKTKIKFKLDTGAEVSVLPYSSFLKLPCASQLKPTKVRLVSFGNHEITPLGAISLNCMHGKHVETITFMVADVKSKPLLGLDACVKLGFIKQVWNVQAHDTKETIIKEHKDIFTGLGKMPGKYKIEMRDDAVPKIQPPRRVPLAIRDKLKDTLDNMETQKVITKVTKPTDWVNSLVIVEKQNGNLRLCLDPVDLNKNIKREHYPIPTADDILANLAGKKIFSILDIKDSFWHVVLDDSCTDLCTFNTPFGRYKFLRMPFGLNSSGEVFQRLNSEIFGDIQGVQVMFDDIIVAGENQKEHDVALEQVLRRARASNVKFNPDKFQFKVNEVKYMGHWVTEKGVFPDPERIRAIVDMPPPSSVEGVRRLLGMLNYVHQFLPNVSAVLAPMRQLLKKEVEWHWEEPQERSFSELKSLLCSTPVLAYFNSKKPLVLQVDASKDGIGACLLQEGHPIAFASRSMNDAEVGYAQIEKELNAIVFGTTKFHYYVYGRKVQVQSDHKPLESIMKKQVNKVSPRLQRLQLKLLKYDLDVTYLPGDKMYLADPLSRAYLKEPVPEDPEMKAVIHTVSKHLPMTEERREQFQLLTKDYDVAQELKSLIAKGWPNHKTQVPRNCREYWSMREEITDDDGLIFVGNKVLVPPTLRVKMLQILHEGHFGIEKCKARARNVMYWPGISKDIYNLVMQCGTCQHFGKQNAKEPLMPHPVPKRAWQTVSADILEYQDKAYLAVKDYYSRWIELVQLKDKTANEVSVKLQSIFARFGIPDTLIADNMPFSSYAFKTFAEQWNFTVKTTSPRFAQSNGMAENAVKIAKTMLRKAIYESKNVSSFLLEYRNTPITNIGLSPAQLLMNRQLKSNLPIIDSLLLPQIQKDVRAKLLKVQDSQKRFFDRTAISLKPLKDNDNILVRKEKVWEPAKVLNRHSAPRSYIIQTEQGSVLRRNRRDLRSYANVDKGGNILYNDQHVVTDPEAANSDEQIKSPDKPRSRRPIVKPTRYKDYV